MEKFLNQKVAIITCLGGGIEGTSTVYEGTITSYDDEFVYLDSKKFTSGIARKYILAIHIK